MKVLFFGSILNVKSSVYMCMCVCVCVCMCVCACLHCSRLTIMSSCVNPLLLSHDNHVTSSRRLRHEPSVFLCISMLAQAVGPQVEAEMKALLEPMFTTGLSPELTSALKILHNKIPQLRRDIMGQWGEGAVGGGVIAEEGHHGSVGEV